MGKLRKWIKDFFDKMIERSFQKQANKMFMKHQVKATDGDNT